jgi:DNA-binding CsgD family transcriptional regulator
MRLLLRVLDGAADQEEYEAITAEPISRLRWDRQFALFASAVLSGRAGRAVAATRAAAEAIRLGTPYATGRHIGLRLVSEAAIVDHWGAPIEWLQASEDYFHNCGVPTVASACRGMLRRAGAPVTQHRRGIQDIPLGLRAAGITVREHEILQLLTERLSNREIAARLHLSPRTVEKHVASLLIKTGHRDRIALGKYGASAASRNTSALRSADAGRARPRRGGLRSPVLPQDRAPNTDRRSPAGGRRRRQAQR